MAFPTDSPRRRRGPLARLVGALALAGLASASAAAAPGPSRPIALGDGLLVAVDPAAGAVLLVEARPGDSWWSLAKRLAGDPRRHLDLSRANDSATLVAGRTYRVPPALWPEGAGPRALRALLPDDEAREDGWAHVVGRAGLLGRAESPWSLARFFTGDGRNHGRLSVPKRATARGLRPGDVVVVPWEIMSAHLRPHREAGSRPDAASAAADGAPTAVDAATLEDDVVADAEPAADGWHDSGCPRHEPAADAADHVEAGARSDDGLLRFELDGRGAHAVYELQAGETLYSDVVMRFTDLLSGRCVNEAAARFAARSDIRDVTNIPVGWPIRIPLHELRPEYLPEGHPRRVAREAQRAAADALAVLPPRRDLEGVHLILDAGHGGLDPGALSGKVWEDDYAYDLACRVKVLLEDRTHATVHPLVEDRSTGHAPLARIRRDTDEVLLTSPALALDEPGSSKVPVNLRWLLANDHRRRLLDRGVSEDQMVFLSIHADSLHETARGAMAYYPQASLRKSRQGVHWPSYRRFREARTENEFRMSSREMLRSEGLSRSLSESLIEAVGEAELPVHRFKPVRGHVVRGKAWIPAVLKYNRIPTAVLFEAVNLNNPEDQVNLRDPAFRQDLAEAIVSGLVRHFEGAEGG